VDWDHTVTRLAVSSTFASVRGLDFYRDPADPVDDVLLVAGSNGTVDVARGVNPATGDTQFASGFYIGGFLRGVWGIHGLNYSLSGSTWEYWTTWGRNTLERFTGASNRTETIGLSIVTPRGVSQDSDGTFWLVNATGDRIVHLDASGTEIEGFSSPGTDPMGLSLGGGP